MSNAVSISKATREILGNRADILKKLEKGDIKQRKIARAILPEIIEKTGIEDISEASIAVAISRFIRELRGSRNGDMTNYIEKVYFQKYLQSASIKTMDNLCKLSMQYLAMKDFSKFLVEFLPKKQMALVLSICYSDGIELYTNEVERENIIKEFKEYLDESAIIQKRDLALLTIQLHKYAESTPGMTTFLTSLVTESGDVRLHDMVVHHGKDHLEYNIVFPSEDLPKVLKIFQNLRTK